MEPSLLSVLPNLGVGVVAVLAIGYIVNKFLYAMDERTKRHEEAMSERENALREVEREIRTSLTDQLTKNTQALERVINHLDRV